MRAGKVRYLGSSTFPASEIVEAQWVAERRHRERFVCEQPPYSMLVRGIEADVLPTCERYGMGVIPWGPLAGGWLSGKWRKGADDLTSRRAQRIPGATTCRSPGTSRSSRRPTRSPSSPTKRGSRSCTSPWPGCCNNPAVTSAIIGPRTMEQLTTQLGAADVQLDGDLLDRIDEIVPPGTNFSLADAGYHHRWSPTRAVAGARADYDGACVCSQPAPP